MIKGVFILIDKYKLVAISMNKNPIIAIHFAPCLSNILPAIGDINPVISAPGKRRAPDCSAEPSLTF